MVHDRAFLRADWRAVAAIFALNGALLGAWAARIPAIAEALSLSHTQLGFVLLVLAGGAVVSFPLAGYVVDRKGSGPITWWLVVAYPASLITLALAPNILWLAVVLFIFGAVHGAMDVAMNAWAADVEKAIGRPAMSSFHAMFSFGAGFGALTGFAAADISVLAHFALAAVVLTLPTLWVSWRQWSDTPVIADGGPIFAIPRGVLALVGLIAFCSALGEGAMIDWSAVYLRDVLETSERLAALGLAAFSTTMMIVRLVGDRLVTRLGPVLAARLAGGTVFLGTTIIVTAGTASAAILGIATMGLGYAVLMPLAFSRAANDPDVPPGRALAQVATLGYGGLLLGPPVIGALAGWTDLRTALSLLAVLGLAIVGLATVLRR